MNSEIRRGQMKRKTFSLLIAFVFILSLPSLIYSESQSHYEYVNSPKTKIYFGHISFDNVKYDGKDPVVIREGRTSPEIAVLNFPLAPGDTIRSSEARRCEIQLDTGTIIRLDLNTELKIETILAQSLSSKNSITNLVLNKGQIYVMYKKYDRREVFQIITPNAAVMMKHNAVAFINAKEDASEQDVDFEFWNKDMNENFIELHKGKSFIPAPVQKFSPAVFYFAQKYSNRHGEWVWNSLYGWVWRPFYNDYYPWGDWQPYMYGNWREVNSELFWVPGESWGWVPYHLGLWVWDQKRGWLWIPGSAFAPAWADWDFYMGYYTWKPWSLMDYYYGGGYYSPGYTRGGGNYYPYYYYYGAGQDPQASRKVLTRIRKDQLKRKDLVYKLPKDLKRIYKRVVTAAGKGDERILGPVRKISDQMITVRREDLNTRRIQVNDSYKEAVRAFNRNSMINTLREKIIRNAAKERVGDRAFPTNKLKTYLSKEELVTSLSSRDPAFRKNVKGTSITIRRSSNMSIRKAPSVRFRDWNPDARVALRAGVSIKYISKNNEISCPELRMSSRNGVVYRSGQATGARLTSSGGISSGSGSGGGSSSGSSSSGTSGSAGSKNSSGSSGGSKSGGVKKK
jgi:hypothetical protein